VGTAATGCSAGRAADAVASAAQTALMWRLIRCQVRDAQWPAATSPHSPKQDLRGGYHAACAIGLSRLRTRTFFAYGCEVNVKLIARFCHALRLWMWRKHGKTESGRHSWELAPCHESGHRSTNRFRKPS
jgi:hypothetical protein